MEFVPIDPDDRVKTAVEFDLTDPADRAKMVVEFDLIDLVDPVRMAAEFDPNDRATVIGPAARAMATAQADQVIGRIVPEDPATGPIIDPIGFPIVTGGTTGVETIATTFGNTGTVVGT